MTSNKISYNPPATFTTTSGRFHTPQGATINSAQNMTLGSDGNTFSVATVAATIDNIIPTGWVNGDEVTLLFNGAVTVKHNTGGGGGTKILLKAGVDFVAAANIALKLQLIDAKWIQL